MHCAKCTRMVRVLDVDNLAERGFLWNLKHSPGMLELRMANVLLICPPSPFLLDDRVVPSLGILQVAASLEQKGHNVSVLDLAGVPKGKMFPAITTRLTEPWDVFGLTATTPQFPHAIEILKVLRQYSPEQRVIIGGPHATVMPESCSMFDTAVVGDGEICIDQAIAAGAPKIIDVDRLTTKGTLQWSWPARHLIDMYSYKYWLGGRPATSMMWSMGCPYGCLWCGGRLLSFYRKQRQRDVNDVVKETEHLVEKYGIGAVTAYDDEVNIKNEPLIDLCNKLVSLGLKYRAFIKANLFTDQQAEAMAKAGFVEVCTGVESGSDRILGIMQKQTSFSINLEARRIAAKHGLRFKAFCSIGHVGETRESIMKTKEWLLEARPDDFDITCVTIYPGTPIYAKRQTSSVDAQGNHVCVYKHESKDPNENGASLFFTEVNYASEFSWYKGKPNEYVSHVWTPDLSKEDLVTLRDQVEDDVRKELGIPYPKRYSGDYLEDSVDKGNNFDHSMGQGLSPQDSRVLLREE